MVTILSVLMLWFAALIPCWFEIAVDEAQHRLIHVGDGLSHMLEVNAGQIVALTVVVAVQTETRNRVGDDSLRRQHVIVGTTKEILLRMRISDEPRAVLREFRPQIRSLIAGQ